MFSVRQIKELDDLLIFRNKFEGILLRKSGGRINASLSLDYLQRASVYGVFDPQNCMRAGYVVNCSAPFRSLDLIPEPAKRMEQVPALDDNSCELVAMWKEPGLSRLASMTTLWPRALAHCYMTGRKFLLGFGYKTKLGDEYLDCGPNVLYSGVSERSSGTHVTVFAFTYGQIAAAFVKRFFARVHGSNRRKEISAARSDADLTVT